MTSRWLPDGPQPVISSACAVYDCTTCETPHCVCTCHLPGGRGDRHYDD